MRVVLIRHSKTAGNLLGRYIGITDEPLCREGIALLKEKTYPEADGLYVSPLKRCRETGKILYPQLTQHVEERLRECDFGEFENKNYKELDGNPRYQAWVDSGGTLPFPGGESRENFSSRCVEGFQNVIFDAETRGFSTIAVILHGGSIMSILEALAVPEKPFYDWQVKNGQGFILEVNKDFHTTGKLAVLGKL